MSFNYKQRISTSVNNQPIDKLLDSFKMETAFITSSVLSCPWGIEIPPLPNCMMFHFIVKGDAEFRTKHDSLKLKTGDFILFPDGQGHTLADSSISTITPLNLLPIQSQTERYETLSFGGGGDIDKLICGAIIFHHPMAMKLLGLLPSYINISADSKFVTSTFKNIYNIIVSESQNISVGTSAVLARLADILVIGAIREYLHQAKFDKESLLWLNALEDSRISKSLNLIHESPEKQWTLDELATAVGMSRTSFAKQFKLLVGNTPIDYLCEWRMGLAYSQLQLSKDTILKIAIECGYKSEAAFSRAFKKIIGKSPGEVRKAYRQLKES